MKEDQHRDQDGRWRQDREKAAKDLTGDIGPELTDMSAYDDAILYEIIYNGIPDGGMPGFASLGSKKVWQMVNYLMYGE